MSNYLKAFGYAPGDYHCQCVACKENFFGDKRATVCKTCAENSAWKPQSDTPARCDELVTTSSITGTLLVTRQNAEEVIQNLKNEIAAKDARIAELNKECDHIADKNNEVVRMYDHVMNECAKLEEKYEALETDNEELTTRIVELTSEVQRLDTPYNPLAEALATDRVKTLEADNAAKDARIKELSEALYKQRVLDNESILYHYNRSKALEADNKRLQTDIDSSASAIAHLKQRVEKAETDNKRWLEALEIIYDHALLCSRLINNDPYAKAYVKGIQDEIRNALGEVKP